LPAKAETKKMQNSTIPTALSSLDQDAILYDLPNSELLTGGAITNACRAAGYDESGNIVVNNLNAWNLTVAKFAELIAPKKIEPVSGPR
jgi:hypothetical protein